MIVARLAEFCSENENFIIYKLYPQLNYNLIKYPTFNLHTELKSHFPLMHSLMFPEHSQNVSRDILWVSLHATCHSGAIET